MSAARQDFQNQTLQSIKELNSWQDAGAELVARWAEDAPDTEVEAWLATFAPEEGWYSDAAGRIAIVRERQGKTESARHFLALAEQALPEDTFARTRAWNGYTAALLRLDRRQDALSFVAGLEEEFSFRPEDELASEMFSICVAGKAYDLAEEHLERAFEDYVYTTKLLPGVFAVIQDREWDQLDRILEAWTQADASMCDDLCAGALDIFLRMQNSEGYLALVLKFPEVLGFRNVLRIALQHLEDQDPERACEYCVEIVGRFPYSHQPYLDIHSYALALLAAYDVDKARELARPILEELDEIKRLPLLVAAQFHDEIQSSFDAAAESDRAAGFNVMHTTLLVAKERKLAELAADQVLSKPQLSLSPRGDYALSLLVATGKQEEVGAFLQTQVEELRALKPGPRDPQCRYVALNAAMLGFTELAMSAVKLPTKTMRDYTLTALGRGAAFVADFDTVLQACRLISDEQQGLSTMVHAWRDYYVQGLIGPMALIPRHIRNKVR